MHEKSSDMVSIMCMSILLCYACCCNMGASVNGVIWRQASALLAKAVQPRLGGLWALSRPYLGAETYFMPTMRDGVLWALPSAGAGLLRACQGLVGGTPGGLPAPGGGTKGLDGERFDREGLGGVGMGDGDGDCGRRGCAGGGTYGAGQGFTSAPGGGCVVDLGALTAAHPSVIRRVWKTIIQASIPLATSRLMG